jgi:hypothetical protein
LRQEFERRTIRIIKPSTRSDLGGLIAPVLSYFADERHMGGALAMTVSTMGFSVLVVIVVAARPRDQGKHLAADLEVFRPAESKPRRARLRKAKCEAQL